MAGYISSETINAINNTIDIVSIVGEYTKLTRRGSNDFWGCCPFHGEKSPSFHVDSDKKFYHCFGCGVSGNAIGFVMEMEKLSYPEALESLAKKAGIVVKYQDGAPSQVKKDDTAEQLIELYDRTASMFNYLLLETDQGKKALDYVLKRGLTRETIEKFKLGYAPADRKWLKGFLRKKNFSDDFLAKSGLFSSKYPDYSFFSDRLMFPICNRNGKVVAFGGRVLPPANEKERKYLNSSDMPQFKKRETLFGFHLARIPIRNNKKVIFCEGNMDVIAYHQCELDYAVATLGTALTEEHIKMIQPFVADGAVYLSFDSDEAGLKATWKAILLCRSFDLTVKIIRLQGGKDPAEIMLKYGKENLTTQVNSAILDSDFILNRLGELYPVDTPEGKRKAAYAYFPYVDSLQSKIQKESSLEQLCQTFNLKPEAVKEDFKNRKHSQERIIIRQENNQTVNNEEIKFDAELRGLIAVTADLDQFKVLRSAVSEDDFSNQTARKLYRLLDECLNENAFTINDILGHCQDKALSSVITDSMVSGAYKQGEQVSTIIKDTINLIKRNKLDARRNKILQRLKDYKAVTKDDEAQLNELILEKMQLDDQIQKLGK